MIRPLLFWMLLIWIPLESSVAVISNRRCFYDGDHLSPQREIRMIAFHAPYKHVEFEETEWKQKVKGKSVALLIHGYNNEYEDALNYFSNVMKSAKGLYDHFVCYLWPGGDNVFDYLFASRKATGEILPKRLKEILVALYSQTAKVDVIAHSMGCKLVLEALRPPSGAGLRNLFLMAPAVDNESIEKGEIYGPSVRKCEQVFVFFSREDGIVTWAYPFIDWDRSLGSSGAEHSDRLSEKIHLVDSTPHIEGHSDYASSEFVFRMISRVTKGLGILSQ